MTANTHTPTKEGRMAKRAKDLESIDTIIRKMFRADGTLKPALLDALLDRRAALVADGEVAKQN